MQKEGANANKPAERASEWKYLVVSASIPERLRVSRRVRKERERRKDFQPLMKADSQG
jgi:hypothetical protein